LHELPAGDERHGQFLLSVIPRDTGLLDVGNHILRGRIRVPVVMHVATAGSEPREYVE
jgi:hypothetical protein